MENATVGGGGGGDGDGDDKEKEETTISGTSSSVL